MELRKKGVTRHLLWEEYCQRMPVRASATRSSAAATRPGASYGATVTVMISQLPKDEWYGCVGDNMLADAILDRLMHNCYRLEMKGESMRKRLAQVDGK